MSDAVPPSADETFPGASFSSVHRVTDNPYLHARALTGWRREVVQLSPGPFLGRVSEVGGSGLFAAEEFVSRGMFHIGSAYGGGLALGIAESRPGVAAIWNGRRFCGDSVLFLPDHREMVFRSYENCRVWWLCVPWRLLGDELRAGFGSAAPTGTAALSLHDGELAASLRTCIRSAHQLAASAPARGSLSGNALAVLQGELVAAARTGAERYLAANPRLGFREAHALRIVWQARAYLRGNVGEAIGLPDLCAAASASERTVRNACEIITGEAPMAFLRAMRLNQVRRALLNAQNPVTVTEIGMRCGFLHLPQFSKDYRQLFGELPSETIRRQLGVGG